MADDMVLARVTFRGHFSPVGEPSRKIWLKIKKGTPGILSDWDDESKRYKTVSFETEGGGMVSASIYYGEGICTKTTFVYQDHFVAT